MNKTTLIVGGILLVGMLFGLAYWLGGGSQKKSGETKVGQVGLPVAPAANGSFTTATTSPVTQTNFLSDPTTAQDPINPGYYYLGYHVSEGVPDSTATENPPYIITYISATHYFNIGIFQEPIGPVRLAAEQYLMARLGISQSQMCKLDYMVSVPDRVNSQFSGLNLGFSFCPGATILPK
jgi:hypothetical protein